VIINKCPHCKYEKCELSIVRESAYSVFCNNCAESGPKESTKKEATNAWNNACMIESCPFCESDNVKIKRDNYRPNAWFVFCRDCQCVGPLEETMKEALGAWKKRTIKTGDKDVNTN
jgi:hypothetical protein